MNATIERAGLTPEQIHHMTGRELDAAVAEHVFESIVIWIGGEPNERSKHPQMGHGWWHRDVADYSSEWTDAIQIRDHIRENWLFSRRMRFKEALQEVVTRRVLDSGRDKGPKDPLIDFSELIMHVIPADFARAVLIAMCTQKEYKQYKCSECGHQWTF